MTEILPFIIGATLALVATHRIAYRMGQTREHRRTAARIIEAKMAGAKAERERWERMDPWSEPLPVQQDAHDVAKGLLQAFDGLQSSIKTNCNPKQKCN